MVLQDRVLLEHYDYKKPKKVIQTKEFTFIESKEDFENYLEIKENQSWRLVFQGEPEDRLYLDGLDLINDPKIKVDLTGRHYLTPTLFGINVLELYRPNLKNNAFASGLLPGDFQLELNASDGIKRYSWLKVNAKYIDNSELTAIKQEVEQLMRGLARDHNRAGYVDVNRHKYTSLTDKDLELIQLLKEKQKDLISNCQQLLLAPKRAIATTYSWQRNRPPIIDQVSIKEMVKRSKPANMVYSKSRIITWKTSENMTLKANLLLLQKAITNTLLNLKRECQSAAGETQNSDLITAGKILKLNRNLINQLLGEDWLKNLPINNGKIRQATLTLDRRYLFFNEIVRALKNSTFEILEFSRKYTYYWKRTELLYEIWSYLKVIQAMTAIGFKTRSGWIFSLDKGEALTPLTDGTAVFMALDSEAGESLFAQVIYNKTIVAKAPEDVNAKDPVWCTSKHNKPDIRINIYDKEMTLVFVIVLDSKYRQLEACNYGDTWEQINSYSNSLYSEYPLKSKRYSFLKGMHIRITPLEEATFILYPKQENETISRLADGRIQAIGLKPNSQDNALESKLSDCISDIKNWINNNADYR